MDEIKQTDVMTKAELQGLYDAASIETVHVVTSCEGATFTATLGGKKSSIKMPPGNYILVRVVEQPTSTPGLFAVVAPKP